MNSATRTASTPLTANARRAKPYRAASDGNAKPRTTSCTAHAATTTSPCLTTSDTFAPNARKLVQRMRDCRDLQRDPCRDCRGREPEKSLRRVLRERWDPDRNEDPQCDRFYDAEGVQFPGPNT